MEVQLLYMEAKAIKLISLLLIVILLGGFSKDKESTVIVETENAKKVNLENLQFGLRKTVEPGTIIKNGRTSEGKVFVHPMTGENFVILNQNKIQYKAGTIFGAAWNVQLDSNDQILFKFQFNDLTAPYSFRGNGLIQTGYIDIKLDQDEPPGDKKLSIFNKGKLVASHTFVISKGYPL
jgi:hypothetical protein